MSANPCTRSQGLLLVVLALALAPSWVAGYQAPFLTTADVQMYFTDTRGIVEADGEPALFYYPNISGVCVGGQALPGVQLRRGLTQVRVGAGRHEVQIVTADGPHPGAGESQPAEARGALSALGVAGGLSTAAHLPLCRQTRAGPRATRGQHETRQDPHHQRSRMAAGRSSP